MKSRILYVIIFIISFIDIGQAILYLEKLPEIDSMFSLLRTISYPIVLFVFVFNKVKWSKFYTLLLLYFLVILSSSILNNIGIPIPLISLGLTSSSLIMCVAIVAQKDMPLAIKMLRDVFNIFILVNFLLVLYSPNGLWIDTINKWTNEEVGRYLVGGNFNQIGASLIVAISSNVIYNIITGKDRFLVWTSIIISIITLAIIGSKTSMVGILILATFHFIKNYKIKRRFLFILFFVYLIFQTYAVFLQSDFSSNELISFFVEKVLKKDLTFSARSAIWFRSMAMIFLSPIIGWGYQDTDWYTTYINSISPHNYIISIMLKGGVLLLIVFLSIVFSLVRNMYVKKTKLSISVIFAFVVFLFMMMMEVYNTIYLISMLTLMFTCLTFQNKLFNHANS